MSALVNGQLLLSPDYHLLLVLLQLLATAFQSDADIVSTSINFTSSRFVPVVTRRLTIGTDPRNPNQSSISLFSSSLGEEHSSDPPSANGGLSLTNRNHELNISLTNTNADHKTVLTKLYGNGSVVTTVLVQSSSTQPPTVSTLVDRTTTVQCDARTNIGCQVNNFERCSNAGRCQCLQGYMVSKEIGICVAVQYFRGSLYLKRTTRLNERSGEYTELKKQLKAELLSVFRAQKVPGLLELQVFQIIWKEDIVEVKFQISLENRLVPKKNDLERLYNKGLANLPNDRKFQYLKPGLIANTSTNKLTEYNHCLDLRYNFCSLNASCTHSMKSFVCKCKPGFDDWSPNTDRTPGEVCKVGCGCQNNGKCDRSNRIEICRCPPSFSGNKCEIGNQISCGCHNNGECELSNGQKKCRCPTWYLGDKCETNGLVIILCSCLGGLLLLTLIICLCCIFVYRRRARKNKKSTTPRHLSASDSTLVKLPRLWTEAGPPTLYEVPAISDRRRWSYVSDPVRYPEDMILEDHYSTGTLPLPRTYDHNRRHLMAYQNPSYQSSTLPLRPAYHQDKWRSVHQPSMSIPF